jgi:AraC-like DNA-binding protein
MHTRDPDFNEDAYILPAVRRLPERVAAVGTLNGDPTYRRYRKWNAGNTFGYTVSGSAVVAIGGRKFTARKDSVHIAPKGSSIEMISNPDDPWRKIWFWVKGTLADEIVIAYGLAHAPYIEHTNLAPHFRRMLAVAENRRDLPAAEVERILIESFHDVVFRLAGIAAGQRDTLSDTARAIRSFLDSRIESSVRLFEIGDLIGRTPAQAIRIFRKEIGTTPCDYLLTRKIEHAKILLAQTSMTLREIARRLSFSDEYYFSNFFKRKTGLSPAQFRRSRAIG